MQPSEILTVIAIAKKEAGKAVLDAGQIGLASLAVTIKGDAGLVGDAGPQGIQGAQGDAGTNGTNGTDGLDGVDGINGLDGHNGRDGVDGAKGERGKDGVTPTAAVSVRDVYVEPDDGHLYVELTNSRIINAGRVKGEDGKDGKNGTNGVMIGSGGGSTTAGGGATYPVGGTTGQVLAKASDANNDVSWQTVSGGGGSAAWGGITGTLANQTDLQNALNGKLQPSNIGSTVQGYTTVLANTTASYTTAEQAKLAGIAAGATANSSDAALLARANHTGTQIASTISDFSAAVAATAAVAANTAKVSNATHTGDATGDMALTLATVNANVGTFGSATTVASVTVNAKGLTTAAASVAISIPVAQLTDSTAQGRSLLTAIDAPAQRSALALGTLATQSGSFSGSSNGANSGDQTSIVGITGTKAQFNTSVTDGDIQYVGDAPTAHTHLLAAGATDVTVTAANINTLDDGLNTALHFHDADRARANHTGTQVSSTVSDFASAADARVVSGITGKQNTLLSGTSIKTVNGNSLLGAGDIVVSGGTVSPVTARVRRSTNQTIPTGAGWTDLSWDIGSYEINGEFWTSGATITIPETGYYQVFIEATFDGTGLLAMATANMQAILNGATVIGDDEKQVLVNAKASMYVMVQRLFTAGDTIKAQVKHSDTGSLNVVAQGDHSPDIVVTKLTGAKGDAGVSSLPITTTFNSTGAWQAYTIPAGATKLVMTCIGPGGNGGAGFSRAAGSAGGGGGGGGGGAVTTTEAIVSRLGVATLQVFPGAGSGGNVSYVSIAADTIAQNLLCRATSGSNAGNGTGSAAGTAGAAGSISTVASTILASIGMPFFAVGQVGAVGGVQTGAVGVAVAWGATGVTVSSGAGGAGCTTTNFAGGAITGAGAVVATVAGGIAAGGAGGAGVTYAGRQMFTGGSGGGSNNTATGGAGGAGAIGSGGGGGGAGVTGGAGGAGGAGLVMITATF